MEMLKEIKTLLGVEETKKVSLAQMKLENGTVLEAESFEAGKEVFIVTEDEKVALPVGEYQLEDGMKLTVVDEGLIESIEEAKDEEEVEEEVEEVEEVEAAEEEKEEMGYATKEELAEVKSMIEEIKAMLEPKEDLSEEVKEEVKEDEVLKEELSAPASEPLKHNPESKEEKTLNLHGQKRPQTTMDRVLNKIINQ